MSSSVQILENEKDRDHMHRGHGVHVEEKQLDEGARLATGREVDPVEALRVRNKIDWHILPMMCILYWIQAMDKTALGSSAILGIRTDTHLNANDNWLSTVFYISYLVFEYPQNLALQRFPVGKWMSINIFVWAVALALHAACTNFGGLFAVRFILGMCEGSITPGFMIVTSMFYTRAEQSKRIGYWFLMNGAAQIIGGFLSFGVLHIAESKVHPWQWYMIITGLMTLLVAACFWLYFPDSPTTAWFLTQEERRIAVERIKVNQTGLENKHFKREQFIEALTEPKTWLFALFAAIDNIPNSLGNQKQIIMNSFGFTTLQTTLLSCVSGVVEIATIWTGVTLAARYRDARAYVAIIYFMPSMLGSILVNALPWSNKVGLLCSVWLTGVGTTGFVLTLGWLMAVTAGHTKRITVNAIMLGAYCVGNIVGPHMWQARFSPRNRVPWSIITICSAICSILLWWIRLILSNENKRRDAKAGTHSSDSEDVYIEEILEDGTKIERKVDRAFLDFTDVQNKEFRYVL